MVKGRKVVAAADEDEIESLMREVHDAEDDDNHNHGHNGNKNGNRTIIIKESSSSSNNNKSTGSSSTVWKVLAVILVGLVVLLATDSIEIKTANKGELKVGDVQERIPNTDEPDPYPAVPVVPEVPTSSISTGKEADVVKTAAEKEEAPAKEEEAPVPAPVPAPVAAPVPAVPVVYENETPRYSYNRRGQPMPDALAKEQVSKWGEWKLTKERPQHDFYKDYPNRDVPRDKFPADAWQLDKEYMTEFLKEGKALVMRAMEAILAEYGHGVDDEPGVPFHNRSAMFNLLRYNVTEAKFDKFGGADKNDGGWSTERSWEGLKRRLLHAVMTEDSFNFAMAGHSASAGHGNHFSQSYSLQVAWIVEPIFARLGVKHQSRNFGNGGLGTQHNAYAGGSLFGPDVDMLMWDSGMTERGNRDPDLMARQGLLGGLKVPVLWNFGHPIMIQYHEKADVDIIVNGDSRLGVPQQDTLPDIDNAVWANKFLKCGPDLKAHCRANEYNGTCWINRPDYTPTTNQKPVPGGRAGWHPGNRIHQIRGRTLAMTILFALHDALSQWSETTDEAESYRLDDDVWHVTEYYENQRTKVMAVDPLETGCGQFEEDHGLGWVCNVPLKGRTEFTPRAYADLTSLRTIMPAAMKEIVGEPEPSAYEPPDVFNEFIHPPLGNIDVLNIVEAGPDFKSVMDPQIYRDFYDETPKDNSMIMKPGKGVCLHTKIAADLCDGTIDSFCDRGPGNACLLYGHNDGRNGHYIDGYSGWAIYKPTIKLGYIAVKFESWHGIAANPKTKEWHSINNENDTETIGGRRQLLLHKKSQGGRQQRGRADYLASRNMTSTPDAAVSDQSRRGLGHAPPFCDEFHFQYAVDGKVTDLNMTEYLEVHQQTQRVVEVITLLKDPEYTGGKEKEVEVAVRVTGCQLRKTFHVTHLYYA
jgi:hypothetical protein